MNEPVAWMETYKGEPNNLDWDKNNLYCEGEFHNVVPLYTHQYERPHNTVLVPCDKLAEMQAEIEALKQIIDANNLNQNIGQFVKPTNEPVAYIDPYDLERLPHYDCHIGSQQLKNGIPLYTHPVKEQDESFDRTASHMAGEYVSWTSCVACGQRVTGDSIHTCSPQLKQLTDEEIIKVNEDIGTCWDVPHRFAIQIARAILRKAQNV